MEKQASSLKIWLNFGLITAAIVIVLDLVFYLLELPRESPIRYISFVVYIGAIIWASKTYRDTKGGGFISFGKSFGVGFMTGFFAALIVAVYVFMFFQYIAPEMVQEILDQQEVKMLERNPNMTNAEIDYAMNMSAKFTTPPIMAFFALLFTTLIVLLVSLVASIFIKREEVLH